MVLTAERQLLVMVSLQLSYKRSLVYAGARMWDWKSWGTCGDAGDVIKYDPKYDSDVSAIWEFPVFGDGFISNLIIKLITIYIKDLRDMDQQI